VEQPQPKQSTPADRKTTMAQIAQWAQTLTQLHARLAPRFAHGLRNEVREPSV